MESLLETPFLSSGATGEEITIAEEEEEEEVKSRQIAQEQRNKVVDDKGRHQLKKKRFLSGIARMMWGGALPMAEFFGPLFRSAFLVNKKSLFLQKCQCIELLTVF